MNIISILSKKELEGIPIMHVLKVINAIQSDYLHESQITRSDIDVSKSICQSDDSTSVL